VDSLSKTLISLQNSMKKIGYSATKFIHIHSTHLKELDGALVMNPSVPSIENKENGARFLTSKQDSSMVSI
ncbi:hypothetical protein NPIL_370351, partial [Nephila pilipes]